MEYLRKYQKLLKYLSASMVLCLSLAVMFGWVIGNNTLISLSPSFAPMQFNTALGFFLATTVLVSKEMKQIQLSKILNTFLFFLCSLTMLQYLFGINIGIDTLFMSRELNTEVSFIPRMSPNTTLCFIFLAVANFCELGVIKTKAKLIDSTLATLVLYSSSFSLITYIIEIDTWLSWQSQTRMALHTSFAFFVLSGHRILLKVIAVDAVNEMKKQIYGLLGILGFVIISISIGINNKEVLTAESAIQNDVKLIQSNIHARIHQLSRSIMTFMLETRLASNDDRSVQSLYKEITSTFKEIESIKIYLKDEIIFDSNPMAQSQNPNDPFKSSMDLRRIVKGDEYRAEAILRLDLLVHTFKEMYAGFQVGLLDGNKNLIAPIKMIPNISKKFKTTDVDIKISDKLLYLSFIPGQSIEKKYFSHTSELLIILGLLLISFISFVLYSYDKTIENEKRLKISEQRYTLATNGAGVGIWDWDITQGKLYLGNKTLQILGQGLDREFTPETILSIIHPKDRQILIRKLKGHFRHESAFDIDLRILKSNNKYRWFRCAGLAIFDNDDKAIRMGGSLEDIEVRKSKFKELERSNLELDSFAKIAAHDFREPVRLIRRLVNYIQTEYEDTFSEEDLKRLKRVEQVGDNMEEYMDSLLILSRLRSEDIKLNGVLVDDIISKIERKYIDAKDISISFTSDAPGIPIVCDERKLTTILTHLVANGIRYNNNEIKTINITHNKRKDGINVFSITDNGIGIDSTQWDNVFSVFKRLNHENRFGHTTGFGLTLVKRTVERHGGEIWIDSSVPDMGTTITFTIDTST